MNDEQMRGGAQGARGAQDDAVAPLSADGPAGNATIDDANSTMGRLKQDPLTPATAEQLGIGGNPNLGRETDHAGDARETADEQVSVDQETALNAD